MIRKAIRLLQSKILTTTPLSLFSTNQQNTSNQSTSKPQKPQVSNKFFHLLTRHIASIRNKVNPQEKESEKQFEKMKIDREGNQQPKINWKALYISIGLALALAGGSSPERSLTGRSGRLVNETQMIQLLTTENFNLDIIILREVVQVEGQLIYQTVCVSKEANKVQLPTTCVITNLPVFLDSLEKIEKPYQVSFNYTSENIPFKLPISIGNILLIGLVGYMFYIFRKGGLKMDHYSNFDEFIGGKKFAPIKPENIKTQFKDVAGMHEAKQEITEFVDFLKKPDRYTDMGAKIPKGALLTGPPGTGKTLLARACAGEAGVPFFYVSGSEFVQKYVGMGANRVRKLFEAAGKSAPSIIFIDEIDAIGKKRSSGPFANEEKENTLNQLLVNMDGFDTKNKIIVMAATNLKSSLDPALLRPGRFDRSIEIGLPNFDQRAQILKVHLSKVKFSKKFTIDELAKKISILTPGFSGAELANICNEAAILAARTNKKEIELGEFEKATQRVMAGLERRNLFSEEEKDSLAYYQCGKTVAAWFSEGADPIIKVSISPHSKTSKGYSHELKNEMPLRTESELITKAVCALAGRTSEKLFKGYITSTGDEDLKKAKRIISFLVVKFGMSKIGKIGFPDIDYVRKPYSDQMERKIDNEIDRIYKECQQKADKLVREKREYIQKLRILILQKEVLTHHTLKQVLGERPFSDNQNYQKLLEQDKTASIPNPQ